MPHPALSELLTHDMCPVEACDLMAYNPWDKALIAYRVCPETCFLERNGSYCSLDSPEITSL